MIHVLTSTNFFDNPEFALTVALLFSLSIHCTALCLCVNVAGNILRLPDGLKREVETEVLEVILLEKRQ